MNSLNTEGDISWLFSTPNVIFIFQLKNCIIVNCHTHSLPGFSKLRSDNLYHCSLDFVSTFLLMQIS